MIKFKKDKLYEYEYRSPKDNFLLMLVYDDVDGTQNNFKIMNYTYICGEAIGGGYRRGDNFDYHARNGEMVGDEKLDFYLDAGTYTHYIKYIGNPEEFPEYFL